MDKLKFITQFPNMIEFGDNKFVGLIHLKNDSIGIQINCPEFPSTTGAMLCLNQNNKIIELCVENSGSDIFHFMETIQRELEGDTSSESTVAEDLLAYEVIFRQLAEIRNENHTIKLSPDYKTVTITEMVNHPGHFLEVRYDTKKQTFHLQNHSLPEKCSSHILKGRTLSEFLNSFTNELTNLEEFYGNLCDIDELCFVIAPVPVTSKDTYRIFKFNEKVFLKLTLDPFVPSSVQLNFIGPLEEVEPLRRVYSEKIDDWDMDEAAHKNLLRMFGLLYFPYRPDRDSAAAERKTCGICFEFNLDNTYPIVSCFNANCEVTFHAICLQKWFDTLTETKSFCTVTSGLCPYCKQKLTMYIDICEASSVAEN